MRYWYHPESSCLFSTSDDEENNDGLCQEVNLETYNRIKKELGMSDNPTAGTYPTRQYDDGSGKPDPASLDLSRLMNEWMEKNGPDGLFKMCANCRHMEKTGPVLCALFNAVPPTPVFLRGCDQHKDVCDIPF